MTRKKQDEKAPEKEIVHAFELYGLKVEFPKPFYQEHLEDWQEKINILEKGNVHNTNAFYRRSIVRATIQCGWATGFTDEAVAKQHPGNVQALSDEIHFFIDTMRKPQSG